MDKKTLRLNKLTEWETWEVILQLEETHLETRNVYLID